MTATESAAKVYRIGLLAPNATPSSAEAEAFRQGLRDRGYVEGRNLIIEYRLAGGQIERYPALAVELVEQRVDLIATVGLPAGLAAKAATSTIPIVMVLASDPVENGLVTSLARPGGNVTGQVTPPTAINSKRLELLKEAFPGIRRVAVLWNAANPIAFSAVMDIQSSATALGVEVLSLEVRTPADFDGAFEAATGNADAFLTPAESLTGSQRPRIFEFAARNRLAAMYDSRDWVEQGGLMSYGANLGEFFRQSATYVDKILKGANPADLPVEQPAVLELVVNLKTARSLGLTIPPAFLARATEVIQ